MNDFHTGLFDCCKAEYTLNNGRVIKFSRLESLKAFVCPCIVLEENTRRLYLEPKSIYCQNWNCLGYFILGMISTAIASIPGQDGLYFSDNILLGAAALHASERDALMRKYGITSERDSAVTCFKTTCCWWMALAQESREITIREQINDPYQAPEISEMEQRFLP
jgi:hypothetical protein